MLLRLATLAVLALLFQPVRPVLADQPMFHAEDGVAIDGYDTVAFFIEGRAVQGRPEFAVVWKGVVWRFVSVDNQYSFEADPRAFAPLFGGYCAYAVSQGYLMSGSPQSWQIVDGDLFLLYSPVVQEIWQSQASDLIALARVNWPEVLRH